jgi:multicomponent K+:H+ antiporter subunit F
VLNTALTIAFFLVGVALLLNLYRLARGPSLPDRVLALDTMYINSITLIMLFGIRTGMTLYFEAALLIALIGFISTVAVTKFLLRGDIIE